MNSPLNSTAVYASVAGDMAAVYAAVERLVERLWPGMTEVVLADPPRILLHHVAGQPHDVDAWLTWELAPAGPAASWTELTLLHDELDTSAGPPPELDRVLALLVESLAGAATR
ncbi:MAG: hypothetical protein ACLGI2_11105 [Acidimicrobiia bacterium]